MSLSAQPESTMSRLLNYLTPSSFRRRTSQEAPSPSVSDSEEDDAPVSTVVEEPQGQSLVAELFPDKNSQSDVTNGIGDEPAKVPEGSRLYTTGRVRH